MPNPLILASQSQARARLLRTVRVEIEVVPARVDEAAVKDSLREAGAAPRDVADALADLKAARVSARHPGRLVLGADQVLAVKDQLLDKPADLQEAREHLMLLRGQRHELFSAAVIYESSRPVWRHVGTARLRMRSFSEAFLERYLSHHGETVLESVGAYKLEEGGAALFDQVEGDYFSVLGLPLLPLLDYLRLRGLAQE